MKHAIVLSDIEVHVDLGAPHVRMRRHGVPHAAFAQMRHSHHQLAASRPLQVYVFADHAMIRIFAAAQFRQDSLLPCVLTLTG